MTKIKIWTEAYRPFIMGGDCNAPVCTEVEVGEPFDLNDEIKAYVVVSPNGNTYVAEATTGAIVGNNAQQVKKDVATADPDVMKEQLEGAKLRFKKAVFIETQEFWRLLRD